MKRSEQLSRLYRRWKKNAPGGLALVGMGLSVTGEAIIMKNNREPVWKWVAWGTAGLALTNAGLSIFGTAVKQKTHIEHLESRRL